MQQDQLSENPHRRYNPLTGDWILVSPHRSKRPWQGQTEKVVEAKRPAHDPACYLCPGNVRANGELTPNYESVFAFNNDFSAILPENSLKNVQDGPLFRAEAEKGLCKVICFSPRHDLTIPEMALKDIRKVVDLWRHEYTALGKLPFVKHVQIFENKGAVQGCSNPHPHGQIWAQQHTPQIPQKKQLQQAKYFKKHGRTLLSDYLIQELDKQERILFQDHHFVALVPFWAVWPFEAIIVPRRPMARITDMDEAECDALAEAYQRLTVRYDNLFEVSFPYSAGIHQAPTDGKSHPEWHWHFTFLPPLLRSATVKKFMVGYEMLAEAQRDITPEKAAEILRGLSEVHYSLATA